MDLMSEEPPTIPYADSRDHVLAELGRVDLWIRAAVARAREGESGADRFRGLYISEEEVDAILARPGELPRWALAAGEDPALAGALVRLDLGIRARVAASVAAGVRLRLLEVASLADLSSFDVDALLVCLAPEIDVRYEKLFAYLHDDVTRRRPSVDLVLNLLCRSLGDKLDARARFLEDAPLARSHVLEPYDDPADAGAPLVGKRLRVDPRIARFLLGSDAIDPVIAPFARLVPAGRAPAAGSLPAAERLDRLAAEGAERGVVHLHGPGGAGKKTWAEALCARLGAGLLVIDGERLLAHKDRSFVELARRCVREAALQGVGLYWDGFDALLADDRRTECDALTRALARAEVLAFLAGRAPWDPGRALWPRPFASVELPRPDPAARHGLWSALLNGSAAPEVAAAIPTLAGHFRFTPGQIEAALHSARDRARARGAARIGVEDIYAGCYGQADRRLADLARKVPPRRGWEALVLPADPLAQLYELSAQIRLRHEVLGRWGFERKLMGGRCVTGLFAGPSGTGKTMAAALIAGELGLDLYKIDLSSVVSKYIGETEKNLARVFDAAETGHAILFFDEADALFGKRSEVKDAHDRYANIEVGYLLQRIEEHDGVVLLATNLRRNIDDAFVRRLSFVVSFPFPEEAERLRIWRSIWPAEAPLGSDLDLAFVARTFRLAGGNIRNAALAAAYLAAARGAPVEMADVIRGVFRELQKMGKTPAVGEFGPYARVLE